jgi:hypothetical protein
MAWPLFLSPMSFRHSDTHRDAIAMKAAQLMAEEGVRDYGFAKRKAARQLGMNETENLPTNAQIEEALRTWQSLYQEEEHPARIRELRETALEVMEWLSDFSPWLTGHVLEGTAGRYPEIDIELYPDSAKDVEIFFLNEEVAYTHRDVRSTLPGAPEAILSFEWNEVPVRLAIFERDHARQSRKQERIKIAGLRNLLDSPLVEKSSPDA